ncbi:MAG: hydroxyisourate hydrolase [Geminicoccaceae bacterium]|nr:hydroxyisourate hydrolase [Geminicoccaceae bacterium]
MAGRLTTHVLDTASGAPAEGLKIELFRRDGSGPALLKTVRTNGDGRVDGPLLEGGEMAAGAYELVFHVGAYYAAGPGTAVADPPFLDEVPIRFGVSDPGAHYHVPLLLAPFGYTTYRGS